MRLLLLLCLVFIMPNTYACSCIEMPTFEQAIKNHDRILVVKLKKYRHFFFQTKYKLKISETLKGSKKPRLKSIAQGKTSCDPELKDKQEWLVFLDKHSEEVQLGWCHPHTLTGHIDIYNPDWKQIIKP